MYTAAAVAFFLVLTDAAMYSVSGKALCGANAAVYNFQHYNSPFLFQYVESFCYIGAKHHVQALDSGTGRPFTEVIVPCDK